MKRIFHQFLFGWYFFPLFNVLGASLPVGLPIDEATTEQALSGETIRDALVQIGLEDVVVKTAPDDLYIQYSDYVYRGPARGAFEVFRLLLDTYQICQQIHLVLLEDRIPQTVWILPQESVRAYQAKKQSLAQLMESLQIGFNTDDYRHVLEGSQSINRSAGKIDFVLYPQVSLNNSWLDKLYGVILNVAPAINMGLWKGG